MRLIDADALSARMYHDAFETDSDMQKWDSGCWIRYKMFEKNLEDAPTIEQPSWIPCSKRLPEENDYKSCIECLDGAVWYFTENGTMGMGYYYKSTKEWSTTDDLKTDGKVVAWMQLPEPYKEGEQE